MASTASPLAGLTETFDEPVQVRPRVAQRTASARVLPTRSTIPKVSLAVPARELPEELQYGMREIVGNAVRENMRIVEDEGSVSGEGWWVWTVG